MIQINLLPPEYRPRTGTPVARFVAIVVGVVLIASATGAWFYTHFIELSNVRELRDVRAEEATTKEQQKMYSLDLQREIAVYEKRREAIQTINRSRTLWSRKLDQFFDITTSQGGDDPYQVWLDSVEVPPQMTSAKRSRGRRKGKGPSHGGMFRFSGYMAMDSSADAPALSSMLFKALTGDPDSSGEKTDFFSDFIAINNPNINIVNQRRDDGLDPPVVGSFRYELLLEPPEKPGSRRKK